MDRRRGSPGPPAPAQTEESPGPETILRSRSSRPGSSESAAPSAIFTQASLNGSPRGSDDELRPAPNEPRPAPDELARHPTSSRPAPDELRPAPTSPPGPASEHRAAGLRERLARPRANQWRIFQYSSRRPRPTVGSGGQTPSSPSCTDPPVDRSARRGPGTAAGARLASAERLGLRLGGRELRRHRRPQPPATLAARPRRGRDLDPGHHGGLPGRGRRARLGAADARCRCEPFGLLGWRDPGGPLSGAAL